MGVDFRNNIMEVDAIDWGRGVTMRLRPGTTTLEILNGTLADDEVTGTGHTIENATVALAQREALNFGTGLTATDNPGTDASDITVDESGFTGIDHGTQLAGLTDDDHTQYALLLGRAGGQILIGGTGASDNLTLRASSNADEGFILVDNQEDGVSIELLRIRSQRATRANNDEVYMTFFQPDNVGAQDELVRLTARNLDVANGEGQLRCRLLAGAGTLDAFIANANLTGAGAFTVNPGGSSGFDFVVVDGAAENILLVDAGSFVVGIGGSVTAGKLGVTDTADGVSRQLLQLRSTRATRANNDEIFQTFFQPDSVGAQHEFGRITNLVSNVTSGSQAGRLELAVSCQSSGGALLELLRIDGATANAVTVNPTGGADTDFIVLGGSQTLILTDAGLEEVAIGAAAVVDGVRLLISTADNNVSTEICRIQSTRATRATNDEIFMSFFQPTLDGTQEEFARLVSVALSVANGAESGVLDITLPNAGTAARIVRFAEATPGTVFNPDQLDINFVIRSPLLTCAFEMDAGRNTVGIGSGAITNVQLSVSNSWLDTPLINIMRLQSARTTRANNDTLFQTWLQPNSVGSPFEFGRITNTITTVTSGSEGGALRFNVSCPSSGGGSVLMVDMDGTAEAVIVNPDQTGVTDFIARGVNEAFLLVVDSGTEEVAIGGPVTSGVQLTIEDDTNAADVELVRYRSTRATRLAGDSTFFGYYQPTSAGAQEEMLRMTVELFDVTAGAPSPDIYWTVNNFGSQQIWLRFSTDQGEIRINDAASNVDTVILGQSALELIHANAALGEVGIGFGGVNGVRLAVQTSDDNASTELFRLQSTRATRADNDNIRISLFQPDDGGTAVETGRITSVFEDVSAATKTSGMNFSILSNNNLFEVLQMRYDPGNTGRIEFNVDNGDLDFRIRTVNATTFVIDGANDNIGLGSAPVAGVKVTIIDDTNTASEELLRLLEQRTVRADGDENYISGFTPDDVGASEEIGRINFIASDVSAATFRGQFMLEVADGQAAAVMQEVWRVGEDNTGALIFGYFGTTQARSTYTRNATVVEDRTLLQSSAATTLNNNNVLAAIIADLQAHGMFLGT